ncbi:hypothetical protein [Mycolicibacterium palauense]|uniref:hypothetical protein n=1 Tax=Mycolicibacterium palauense TaxID=2034511 RepID=UPI00159BBC86|nr:hypothetical protein [Mycolicibacterium palauense]
MKPKYVQKLDTTIFADIFSTLGFGTFHVRTALARSRCIRDALAHAALEALLRAHRQNNPLKAPLRSLRRHDIRVAGGIAVKLVFIWKACL